MDVRLALTGFGNVGQGVARLLLENGDDYQRRYGLRLALTGVVDRGGAAVDRGGLDLAQLLEAKTTAGTVCAYQGGAPAPAGERFLDQAEANILLETASTSFEDAEPGRPYVRGALTRGMDIVLASKGVLALHYGELMEEARNRNVRVRFSATIGAPLPSLEIAERALVSTTIRGFEGILNGTTNYILTAMSEGASYEEGVRQAQEMGIAETDPNLDVDGWDAAAKAVIVANTVLGASLTLSEVSRQGIRQISAQDLAEAHRDGATIKLIARASRSSRGVQAQVQPERRPETDVLGRLRYDEMGMVFMAEKLGNIATTVGRSEHSGGISTALTVLRDVLNLTRDRG